MNRSHPQHNFHRRAHSLQEIIPSDYISNPQELIIATAIKNWLLSIPDPLRKVVLKRVVNPTVFRLHPADPNKDASVMRSSINFPELLEITTVAVEAARQQLEETEQTTEADFFYEKLAAYCDTLNVQSILQNAGDGFMEFLCDCYLLGR